MSEPATICSGAEVLADFTNPDGWTLERDLLVYTKHLSTAPEEYLLRGLYQTMLGTLGVPTDQETIHNALGYTESMVSLPSTVYETLIKPPTQTETLEADRSIFSQGWIGDGNGALIKPLPAIEGQSLFEVIRRRVVFNHVGDKFGVDVTPGDQTSPDELLVSADDYSRHISYRIPKRSAG